MAVKKVGPANWAEAAQEISKVTTKPKPQNNFWERFEKFEEALKAKKDK